MITSAAQSGSVKEDTTLTATGTVSASDVDHGATASYSGNATGTYGSFAVNAATGVWTYTLDNGGHQDLAEGESHDETFTVTVTDDKGATATQNVVIHIAGTNDAPTGSATAVLALGTEDTPYLVSAATLLQGFSDVDNGATLQVNGLSANHATVTDLGGGQFKITPNANYNGPVILNYTVSDGLGGSVAATQSFALGAVADLTAQNDSFTGSEDIAINGSVAANDSTTSGGSLAYTLATGPAHGIVTFNANGTFSYNPTLNYNGSDSFTYTVIDAASGESATRTVDLTIAAVNDAAMIGGIRTGTVVEAGSANGGGTPSATGTLTASDVDNPANTFTASSGSATYGSFTMSAGGVWTYTLNNGNAAVNALNGGGSLSDSFIVTSVDGTQQTINVTINGANDAATIGGTSTGTVTEATTANSGIPSATGTLTDTDVDNPANTFTASSGSATYGSFTMSAGGVWTYTLNNANPTVNALSTGQTLNDSFTVTTVDGTQQTVSVTINGVSDNNPPIVANDTIWVSNGTTVTLPPAALLANDVDIDGISLSLTNIVVASGTLAGPVTINADGSFTFTTGAVGGTVSAPSVVTLTYTTSDGAGGTSTGTVTVNIVNTTAGADTINLTGVGAYQASYISGGAGADIITDGSAISVLNGGAGADTLTGNSGDDLLVGGDQNDTLSGGAGNDILRGGIGNSDTMDGGAGSEDLLDFSDGTLGVIFTLVQSAASTSIANGTGGLGNNDTYQNIEGVIGSSLNDSITGSSGNDILRGGGGNDTLNGAGGTDLIDFTDGTSGINFTLVQSAGATVANLASAGLGTDTYSNFEGVIGTAFADTLTGSNSNDELRGGSGNDTISGLGGNDRIIGGDGADILTGGLGNDTFVFSSALNNVDTITDFNANATDKIELDDATFTALIAGSLNSANFAANSGGNAVDANDFILFDTATGDLFYDADGSGAAAKILFAHIDLGGLIGGTPALDATDFIIA